MQYILFDWKWYGPAFDFASDASKVVAPGLDMPKVIAYGKEKGIGVWLYVNQQALQTQADVIFPIYRQWGIAGVKFGFVQFATHHWSLWVHETIKKAAQNNLMVNIHDEYRPTGNQRTWPNLLTAEGIRGNEEFPSASHNTYLPFTRSITGPADYTICYFDPRLIHTTHAHQLALPVIFFSPLQTFYWYDTPKRIQEVPELEFFDKVPVVWDDTKVLHDNMGSLVTIARRNGNEWFSGTICGNEPKNMVLPLDFLEAGKTYVANIYTDDESVSTVTKVKISKMLVDSRQHLTFDLIAGGGCAIHFEPASKDNSKGLKKYKEKTK
jgi:alpha-glucosidase